MNYPTRVILSFDQLINTILGGRPDHTVSGRVGYNAINGKRWAIILEKIIDWLFFWEDKHCFNSIEWDEVDKDVNDSH